MTWVKIDDGITEHPKIIAVGPIGFWVNAQAICYCARNLTDGFIPASVARMFGLNGTEHIGIDEARVKRKGKVIATSGRDAHEIDWPEVMVDAGLWEETEGGYLVHDYLAYNPSKERVLKERAFWRQRQGRHRRPETALLPGVTDGVTVGVTGGVTGGVTVGVTGGLSVSRSRSRSRTTGTHPLKSHEKGNGRFAPPTKEEVEAFWRERSLRGDPDAFFDHFENADWRLSSGRGARMKDWRLAAQNWSRNDDRYGRGGARPAQAFRGTPDRYKDLKVKRIESRDVNKSKEVKDGATDTGKDPD